MFGDLNEVKLIGNITNDLQVKYLPNGSAVINFGLATNRRYKSTATNEWKDDTTFHNLVLFGNQAESISQRARKGTRIFASGRLQTRSWQDKDGKNNYKTEVVIDRIILLDRYERGSMQGEGSGYSKPYEGQSAGAPPAEEFEEQESKPSKKKKSQADNVIDPDDLPF